MTTVPKPASRPGRGLSAEAALERWSDPAAFGGMTEYADALNRHIDTPDGTRRHFEAHKRRDALEAALLERVRAGDILVSAVVGRPETRAIVSLAALELLDIDYDFDRLAGEGRQYDRAEFFEPSAIPLNVEGVPEWVSRLPSFHLPAPVANILLASMPVLFAMEGQSIKFNSGLNLTDDRAALILALLPNYREGIASVHSPDLFACIRASDLAGSFKVDEQSLRRRIGRARDLVAASFKDCFGMVLDMDDVIENVSGKGYRLNPRIILVQPFQLPNGM